MHRAFLVQFAAVLMVLVASSDADARRRARIPFIVGGGGGGSIVKVIDLPDIPALKRKDGKYIDLGYHHFSSGGGEWVGYVGSSRRYLRLTPHTLKGLMLVGGIDKLPPPPKRSSASSAMGGIWMLLLGVGALAILWKIVSVIRGLVGAGARTAARGIAAASAVPQQDPAWMRPLRQWTHTSPPLDLPRPNRVLPQAAPACPAVHPPPAFSPNLRAVPSHPSAVNALSSGVARAPSDWRIAIRSGQLASNRRHVPRPHSAGRRPPGRRISRQPAAGPPCNSGLFSRHYDHGLHTLETEPATCLLA